MVGHFVSALAELASQSLRIPDCGSRTRLWLPPQMGGWFPLRLEKPVFCCKQVVPGQEHVHHDLTFASRFCMQGRAAADSGFLATGLLIAIEQDCWDLHLSTGPREMDGKSEGLGRLTVRAEGPAFALTGNGSSSHCPCTKAACVPTFTWIESILIALQTDNVKWYAGR